MKRHFLIPVVLLSALAVFAQGSSEGSAKAPEKKGGASELLGPGNVTLKRLGYNTGFDVNTDYMVPVMEKSTGYKVEFSMLPAQNPDQKLLMDVASGADYDIVNLSLNQFRTLLSKNALLPLNDLLDKYGQDILKGNSQETWDTLSDGKGTIYGVPYMYSYDTEISKFIIVRMDLLRQAGIDKVPTTIDELYATMSELKSYYGDEYILLCGPYNAASEGIVNLNFPMNIACAFGIYNDWMVDDNGKVIYLTEHPKFKEMVEFLTKCSKEGLFDSDWAANTTTSVSEKFASGKAIMACADRSLAQNAIPALKKTYSLSDDDFGFVSALFGADGTCKYMKTTAINHVSAILRGSKHPADAVNWMNLKVKDQLFINIGVEGTHFKWDPNDHSIIPINPIFADERGDSYYYIDATDAEAYKWQWPSRIRKSAAQWLAFNAVTIDFSKKHPEVFVPAYFSFMPASPNYAKYETTLSNNVNDFIFQIMAGTRTINDLSSFQKDWTAAGGEQVRAELQSYLDSKK